MIGQVLLDHEEQGRTGGHGTADPAEHRADDLAVRPEGGPPRRQHVRDGYSGGTVRGDTAL